MPPAQSRRLSATEFMAGLLYGLKLRGITQMSYDEVEFSSRCKVAFDRLQKQEAALKLDLAFSIYPSRLNKNSQTAVNALLGHGFLAKFEAPRFDAFNIDCLPSEATEHLRAMPGGVALWEELAAAFLSDDD